MVFGASDATAAEALTPTVAEPALVVAVWPPYDVVVPYSKE